MGSEDVKRQSPNVYRMKLLGATVIPVESGSKTLKDALNEALRDWVTNVSDTFYIIGTVAGPHPYPMMVRDFNSVVGKDGDYRENMEEDLIALWKVWIPSMFINFGFMPMWGRIPWVASTSLIWTCILSAMRGASNAREVVAGERLGEGVPSGLANTVEIEAAQRANQSVDQDSAFVVMPQPLGAR
jgi:hypothetical protein